MKTHRIDRIVKSFLACCAICFLLPVLSSAEDRLVVKDNGGTTTFKVDDLGYVRHSRALLSNGANFWGSAPFVLGQDVGNRGIVVTNKAATNPKNIYIGWDINASQNYMEIFALEENVAFRDLILNPHQGGNVGIWTTEPAYPLEVNGDIGAQDFIQTSSRKYKENIREIDVEEAVEAVKNLTPVHYNFKTNKGEKKVGFIAEEVPEIVATSDREHLSTMDIVAVLTKVVQQQQEEIQKLNKRLNEIESR
jgi:hypothetical protein